MMQITYNALLMDSETMLDLIDTTKWNSVLRTFKEEEEYMEYQTMDRGAVHVKTRGATNHLIIQLPEPDAMRCIQETWRDRPACRSWRRPALGDFWRAESPSRHRRLPQRLSQR